MNATIIVDWPLYQSNPWVQDFVSAREGQARMVLVVPEPETTDYVFGLPKFTPEIAWDAIIRNSGGLESVAFKATALSVLQDASNLEIVIALDADAEVNGMYREGGVLVTVEDL